MATGTNMPPRAARLERAVPLPDGTAAAGGQHPVQRRGPVGISASRFAAAVREVLKD
jgi:hypothetical protein